jgi:hypothetical protein
MMVMGLDGNAAWAPALSATAASAAGTSDWNSFFMGNSEGKNRAIIETHRRCCTTGTT